MSVPILSDEGAKLRLGDGFGIEVELMIVDRETLAVRPIADQLLSVFTGGEPTDFCDGPVAMSNELTLHVIELKTNGPTPSLAGWAGAFHQQVVRIDRALEAFGARLLPGPVHPTMDPVKETVLWPHDYGEVYATYDRIFDCKRHGWANLQSCHVNLPFGSDEEFERLHAAIRAVLPLMPALAAASPVLDGKRAEALDARLDHYLTHQARIPEAMGLVVPERIRTQQEYEETIYAPLRERAKVLDPSGTLRPVFLNARGAIARFDRGAIEIRVLDSQECPRMDLAIALLIEATVRAVAEERWASLDDLHALETAPLAATLRKVVRTAERTEIVNTPLLRIFGLDGEREAGDVWSHIADQVAGTGDAWRELGPPIESILRDGPLGRRLATSLGHAPDRELIDVVWRRLGRCLQHGSTYSA